jgi:polyphosphate kinase
MQHKEIRLYMDKKLSTSSCPYLNRELSVLYFNARVLAQASDPSLPLLERFNFILICSSNLDEFFEIRVPQLQLQARQQPNSQTLDGYPARMVLKEIHRVTHELVEQQYRLLNQTIFPALTATKIQIVDQQNWTVQQRKWLKEYFNNQILPLLSPVALDPAHPFPKIANKSLNLIVSLDGKDAFGRDPGLAVIHAPRSLPRLIRLPGKSDNFVYLSALITAYAEKLFVGMEMTGCYQFRITRNSDVKFNSEDVEDLPKALQYELFDRHYGDASRLEIAKDCPREIAKFLLKTLRLTEDDLYLIDGQVNLSRYRILFNLIDRPQLRYEPFIPSIPEELAKHKDFFAQIRNNDILLHHPFQSFGPVVNFVEHASNDKQVLAIKITLYRTGAESPIVKALAQAARAGKEVTAVIELRARFDEAYNIELANRLHAAGVLVIYGVLGFKTHAKMMLIIRQEGDQLASYAHMATGNYHANTAKMYVDYSFFTCNKEITHDVQSVFQQLTGMGQAVKLKRLLHAPFTLFNRIKQHIENAALCAKQGKPARIIAKMNALTEPKIIQALYAASQAGVEIQLIIRGACCLRPGIANLSQNIQVRSIVGRHLEHSRIYYFSYDDTEHLYLASADWMARNLFQRVEVCFPIENSVLRARIIEEALASYWKDNQCAWSLMANGTYQKITPKTDEPKHNAQLLLLQKYAYIDNQPQD